jgi:Na+/H+-dicarboxylate symporter
VLFITLLVAAAGFSLAVGVPAIARMPIDPVAAQAMRETAGEALTTPGAVPGLAEWIVDLVPVNPIRAAADAAMLPLIIFSLLFGLAVNRVTDERREAVVRFFGGVADAMFVLVRWILAMAPLGVFALAMAMTARIGLSVAGALAYYMGLVIVLMLAFMALVLYPVAIVGGRMPLAQFARGSAAAQSVGFSSRSSLASLPAMIEGARSVFRSSEETLAFLLPLAAAVFKVGGAIVQVIGVLFIARLYDVPLAGSQLLTIAATVVVTTFSAASIPGGSIIAMVPVLVAAGVPVQGMGLLLGVDTLPDMFRTMTNITGGMTAAAVLGRTRDSRMENAD